MLEAAGLDVHYGRTQVLWDISLAVDRGEIVSVMGPNGSGKSTILKTIIGLVRSSGGHIRFEGRDITRLPTHQMAGIGVGMVLERRRLFPRMSVHENVLMGAYNPRARRNSSRILSWVSDLFPIVRDRARESAGRLSGGQQQMVALARALMSEPRLLLMDEPFLGLAPRIVRQSVDIMKMINGEGIAILFNEQNAKLSFSISNRGYLLESGRIVLSGSGTEMLEDNRVKRVYLGY